MRGVGERYLEPLWQQAPSPYRLIALPAVNVQSPTPCPTRPTVTCTAPACVSTGSSPPVSIAQLLGSCTASDAAASLVYLVAGQPAVSAVCPAAGAAAQSVFVQPLYGARPDCPYNATFAYNLTGAHAWRGASCTGSRGLFGGSRAERPRPRPQAGIEGALEA
jgi:hypothetical protein